MSNRNKNEEFETFEDYKIRLIKLAGSEEYEKLIEECNEMIKLVNKQKNTDTKQYLCYSYYVIARSMQLLYGNKKLNKTIQHIQRSIKYFYLDSDYIKSIWMLAISYGMTNHVEKALRIYDRCIFYYSQMGNKLLMANVMNTKALLENDQEGMEHSVEILESMSNEDITNGGYKKDELLNEAYKNLFKVYSYYYSLDKSNSINKKMLKTLHNITCIKVRKQLRDQLLAQHNIA